MYDLEFRSKDGVQNLGPERGPIPRVGELVRFSEPGAVPKTYRVEQVLYDLARVHYEHATAVVLVEDIGQDLDYAKFDEGMDGGHDQG